MLIGNNHFYTTDWWGLGSLTYEMIVGIPPFYHDDQSKISKKICKSPVKFPSDNYLVIFTSFLFM